MVKIEQSSVRSLGVAQWHPWWLHGVGHLVTLALVDDEHVGILLVHSLLVGEVGWFGYCHVQDEGRPLVCEAGASQRVVEDVEPSFS